MPYTPADAALAARNTFLQGLLAALAIGGLTGALEVLNAGDFTWRTVGISAGSAAIASVLAYLQHAYVAPYLRVRQSNRDTSA